MNVVSPVLAADQGGGRFAFSYPNFTNTTGAMTAQQYVQTFAAAMHNPNVYKQWITSGQDVRKLNPSGVYLKHLNLRTIDSSQREPSIEGHPNYDWIHANHPEWILHDANGKTIPLFIPTEECLDFGNDAYLDWVLNTWMPNNYFDSTDSDLAAVMWYLQDNGQFLKLNVTCAADDPICQKYTTDTGVQTAFKHMFDRFHAKYPNKRIFVNTGVLSYMTPSVQLPWMEDVLSHADGYFSEMLTNDHSYWNGQSNADKRNALNATLQLADWLASNGKYFFPNLGMYDGTQPTQEQVNYAFAFFNLLRNGNNQFFSIVEKDSSGNWQPRTYPEQNLALGNATEPRQQTSPNVYRRRFQNATAYVNLSDGQVSINLPPGTYKNSLGQAVSSPLSLSSFSGLTIYGSSSQPSPSPSPTPTPTPKPTATPTPSASPSFTPSPTATASASPTPSPTVTSTPTPSPSPSTSPTPTATPSPTSSPTSTATATPTPSAFPTVTPTVTPTPSATATPTPAESATPSPSPAPTVIVTPPPSATPSPTPTSTETATPTATPTPFATASPSPTESPILTPTPSATASPTLKRGKRRKPRPHSTATSFLSQDITTASVSDLSGEPVTDRLHLSP